MLRCGSVYAVGHAHALPACRCPLSPPLPPRSTKCAMCLCLDAAHWHCWFVILLMAHQMLVPVTECERGGRGRRRSFARSPHLCPRACVPALGSACRVTPTSSTKQALAPISDPHTPSTRPLVGHAPCRLSVDLLPPRSTGVPGSDKARCATARHHSQNPGHSKEGPSPTGGQLTGSMKTTGKGGEQQGAHKF